MGVERIQPASVVVGYADPQLRPAGLGIALDLAPYVRSVSKVPRTAGRSNSDSCLAKL